MKRYSITPGRVSVSLPGYDVDRAGLAGMAFDSRFASIENAVDGETFIYAINPNDRASYFGNTIHFGVNFGLPPFFYCAARLNSKIDISHVKDFPPLAYAGQDVNDYRPKNGNQVTAWVRPNSVTMQIDGNAPSSTMRFLALA